MRVLLVEDEQDLGSIIQRTLQREKYIVDWVQDGFTAWDFLQSLEYQVAVFDWLLPKLSGIELCRKLREIGNSTPILMLTAKDKIENRVMGLDAGADDYLVKPFSNAELLARLRALQRRNQSRPPIKLRVSGLILDYNSYTIGQESGVKIDLTAKEFQILEYFMKHPDQILTHDQILDQVWSMESEPISNVVPAQIRLLRKKLANYGFSSLIETVHGLGYRFKSNENNE